MPALSTHRPLPAEIADAQAEMEGHARDYGLDFFETIFEVLDYDEISMVAAYGGFPVRYPHWRFGAQYEELTKSYSYGLSKIYEMVINTDPCYAYLLACNPMLDQKLVIAHVYGHCDFFKNNAWFAHTNRRMLDQMANHAARVSRYIDRFGYDVVEQFIDACLSLEDLIDVYSPHIRRKEPVEHPVASACPRIKDREDGSAPRAEEVSLEGLHGGLHQSARRPAGRSRSAREGRTGKGEKTVVPRRAAARRAAVSARSRPVERMAARRAVDHPRRGVLFRSAGADENHERRLGQLLAQQDHDAPRPDRLRSLIDYADHHSGTMATSRNRLNPYKLGIELLKDIEERWNRGQFGPEYDDCTDAARAREMGQATGAGAAEDLRGPPGP